VRQPGRTDRQGYKTGYQVSHEFAVTQGAKSVGCLHELREFFGVGQVLVNQRTDNHTETCIAMWFVDARTCSRR
jgi:hypothetical protein